MLVVEVAIDFFQVNSFSAGVGWCWLVALVNDGILQLLLGVSDRLCLAQLKFLSEIVQERFELLVVRVQSISLAARRRVYCFAHGSVHVGTRSLNVTDWFSVSEVAHGRQLRIFARCFGSNFF